MVKHIKTHFFKQNHVKWQNLNLWIIIQWGAKLWNTLIITIIGEIFIFIKYMPIYIVICHHIWEHMEDGVSPHLSISSSWLKNCFPKWWFGRRERIAWSPRSQDLTPTDFFLWGDLQLSVYLARSRNLQDLKSKIGLEIRTVIPERIHNVEEECCRCSYCQETSS